MEISNNKTMKRNILSILIIFFTSCAVTTDYFQVYKTISENGIVNQNQIVFEDNNCAVYYNLWSEGGDVSFKVYNKTENDLTVYLTKTFFVLNGVAYEYFQNRSFSKSSNSGTTVTSYNYPYFWNQNVSKVAGTNSTTFTTSYVEKPELTVPPKTLVNISEYHVTNKPYTNCDFVKYPSVKNIRALKYTKENSPFVFYNLITYATKSDTLRLENKFYVSEITNYPSSKMYTDIDTSICGRKLDFPVRTFKTLSPDKFYIKYKKEY
jgi:hypothetical protein